MTWNLDTLFYNITNRTSLQEPRAAATRAAFKGLAQRNDISLFQEVHGHEGNLAEVHSHLPGYAIFGRFLEAAAGGLLTVIAPHLLSRVRQIECVGEVRGTALAHLLTFASETALLVINVHIEPQAGMSEKRGRLQWFRRVIDAHRVMTIVGGDFNFLHSDEVRESATGELLGGAADPVAVQWERTFPDLIEVSQSEPTRRQIVAGAVVGTARLDRFYVKMKAWAALDCKPIFPFSGRSILMILPPTTGQWR